MKAASPKSVVMVAGEASGDLHGAHVIQALKKCHGDIFICGAGSSAMKAAGAKLVVDANELSVMGFTAIFAKAPQILKALSRLKKLLATLRPDLLILIDFPDFNLHLAASAKKLGIPVLYYISPTVWAWRANRIHKIKQRVDHMAVILPFEKTIYEKHNVPVSFVGHPLLDSMADQPATSAIASITDRPTIGLLPGSREDEVRRLLPNMLQAACILQQKNPYAHFVISCAPSIEMHLIEDIAARYDLKKMEVVNEHVSTLFPRCCLSIVASGTASLEAALYGMPNIIVYSVSPFSYWLGSLLVDVPHIGLANLIANRRIIPELVQDDVTPEKIADIANGLLTDSRAYKEMCDELIKVRQRLGQAGASARVAEIACRLMGCGCAV